MSAGAFNAGAVVGSLQLDASPAIKSLKMVENQTRDTTGKITDAWAKMEASQSRMAGDMTLRWTRANMALAKGTDQVAAATQRHMAALQTYVTRYASSTNLAARERAAAAQAELRSLSQQDRTVSRLTSTWAAFSSTLMTASLSLAAFGAGGLLVGRNLVGAAGQMERFQAQFTVLTGSAEKAKLRIAELTKFAAKTPFDLPGVIQADRLVQAFNLDLGGLDKTLRTFGDAAAAMGVPLDQVIRVMAKLKAGMFDMAETAPLGITRDKLRELGIEFSKAGEVMNREDLWPAAIKLMERFGGTMEKQSKTLEGKLSNLRDAMFQTSAELGTRLLPMMKEFADKAIVAFDAVQKWAKANPDLAASLTKIGLGAAAVAAVTGALGLMIAKLGDAAKALGVARVATLATRIAPRTISS